MKPIKITLEFTRDEILTLVEHIPGVQVYIAEFRQQDKKIILPLEKLFRACLIQAQTKPFEAPKE